jgi:hypothetical protein
LICSIGGIYTAVRNIIEALFNRLREDELSIVIMQESATLNEAVFFFSEEGREEIAAILHLVESYMCAVWLAFMTTAFPALCTVSQRPLHPDW